jgi:sugar lactone lactonase YvrE
MQYKKYFLGVFILSLITLNQITVTGSDKNTSNRKKAEVVYKAKMNLGEGAIWDYKNDRLLWIDIQGKKLLIYKPSTGKNMSYNLPGRPGTVVPYSKDSVLIAMEKGIYVFDLKSETLSLQTRPEPDTINSRFNDGKCDPAGRFWVGSMATGKNRNAGTLYQVNHDYSVIPRIKNVSISNGIVWSPGGNKMYYIDTPTRKVAEYDFNKKSGEIEFVRYAISIPDSLGHPDGSTIDREGNIWIAMWGGHCVTKWNPQTGALLDQISVDAENVTSCAFGGKNLDQLYITTAGGNKNKSDSTDELRDGSLFIAHPGVQGIKAFYFRNE